jgi:LAGLIDADG-like domain
VRLDHLLSKESIRFLVEDTGFHGRHTVECSRSGPEWAAFSVVGQIYAQFMHPKAVNAGLLTEVGRASKEEIGGYLLGAAHDGTISKRHRTTRFGQSDFRWLEVLRVALLSLGYRSWSYREGASRALWVLETSWLPGSVSICTEHQARGYVRGYFDAEGGVPRSSGARMYIQFVQKDRADLERCREMLMCLGVSSGKIHNPSVRVDPDYWRFYVPVRSHVAFVAAVGSWHPRKREIFEERVGRPDCHSISTSAPLAGQH